jgi:hypothetical protein
MAALVADASPNVLTDDLIERCGERAAGYDRENRFFFEDFEDLSRRWLPQRAGAKGSRGCLGLSLAGLCKEQERLAYRAPATALAVNMRLCWTGTR